MKTVAILCLVVLVPCVWTRSIQPAEVSDEELIDFVTDVISGLGTAVDELQSSFETSLFKRFLDYDLGHGVSVGSGGLTYTNGNFGANVKPTFNGGNPGVSVGISYKW